MGVWEIVLGIVLLVMSAVLIVCVLMQSGKDKRLSGTIAGGAETFFGKNKGRSLDAKLKKWTTVVAVLFLVSSIGLNIVITAEDKKLEAETQAMIEEQAKAEAEAQNLVEEEAEAPVEEEAAE